MTKYRITAYTHNCVTLYGIQRREWWGWKTIVDGIVSEIRAEREALHLANVNAKLNTIFKEFREGREQ